MIRLALAITLLAAPAMAANENAWNLAICEKLGGEVEVSTPFRTRVDCLTETHAYEGEWADKWTQALGQAMHYADMFGRQPGIILLCRQTIDQCRMDYALLRMTIAAWMDIRTWSIRLVDARGEPGA